VPKLRHRKAPAGGSAPLALRPGDYHDFVPGEAFVDAAGHNRVRCYLCGKPANAPSHRSPERMAAATAAMRAGRHRPKKPTLLPAIVHVAPAPVAQPVAQPIQAPPDWKLYLLRHAVELALDAGIDDDAVALRARELQRALRSRFYGTRTPEPKGATPKIVAKPLTEPRQTVITSDEARRVAKTFRGDKQRALFLRAVDAGWRFDRTGTGHVRLLGPEGQTLIVSTTAIADRGHGYRNLRADAKRKGLDVEGL